MKNNLTIYDAHCDTASLLTENTNLYSNNLNIDLERALCYGGYMQVFAIFSDPEYGIGCKNKCLDILSTFKKQAHNNYKTMSICTNSDEIHIAVKEGKIAAVLALEGADLIQTTEDINMLYNNSIRIITLTWNGSNKIASGIDADTDTGLSEFGKKAVAVMNDIGIIIDISHASERTFYDIAQNSTAPFMASHSNSKTICSNRRNLTDNQFTVLCKLGGYIGINFYPLFLNDSAKASTDDIIRHIDHFLCLGGENHIGLGSDFDGTASLPDGISGIQDMYKISDALYKNYNSMVCEKILWGNFDAFLKKML